MEIIVLMISVPSKPRTMDLDDDIYILNCLGYPM
jgi:hypothetical protein